MAPMALAQAQVLAFIAQHDYIGYVDIKGVTSVKVTSTRKRELMQVTINKKLLDLNIKKPSMNDV